MSLRASLVGRTPVGLRMSDALAALDWLATRDEVDARQLHVYGVGALAPVALHVGILDTRIAAVTSDNGILRYRDFVTDPVAHNMAEVNLPGVLRHYDLPDLMVALGDRLTLVSPVNARGEALRERDVRAMLPSVRRIAFRSPRDPIRPPGR